MRTSSLRGAVLRTLVTLGAGTVLAGVALPDAGAGDAVLSSKLPFSDDVAPPPPLPRPIDRAFRGELVSFDGERVSLRWDWKDPQQLDDFEAFVPVRSTLVGSIAVKDEHLLAEGTAGIRLRLAMLSDLEVHVGAKLASPHDLGIVLALPGSDDDSVLCLVQDNVFTSFDGAAGHTNMINRLGGIPVEHAGMTEFRYIARNLQPRIAPGDTVQFDVVRKAVETTFTLTPKGKDGEAIRGRDTTPLARCTPGLYVSGGAAEFGPLTISGKIDAAWCGAHGLLPHVAANLLHPGNKWKPEEKKAAELVERFVHPDPAAQKAPRAVAPEAVAALIGDAHVPLVIRIRAAEALLTTGTNEFADRLALLLDAKDQPTRTLAWQVLRPQLPWHFHYEVDADAKIRRDASQLICAFFKDRAAAESAGKVYVEGTWCTPDEADVARADWNRAWDLRTRRIRLRTNLPRAKADWFLAALEAAYGEMVKLVGVEPPAQCLPLSVFVFKDKPDFASFCTASGYEPKAAWGRFTDLDRNVSFTAFGPADGIANCLGQFAKQFHRFATGKFWPVWYDEGRAAWFGSADYGTVSFDGTTLTVGQPGKGSSIDVMKLAAVGGKLPTIESVVAGDPRNLAGEDRRIWYAETWALHAWLMQAASDAIKGRFAEWQSAMGRLPTAPSDVDAVGLREFLARFKGDLPDMDRAFKDWVAKL